MSDSATSTSVKNPVTVAEWRDLVKEFQEPSTPRATWQIINTIGSYVVLWVLMYFALKISWWLVVPLAIVAGGLLVRVFIIFHDCGHGSFVKSRTANDVLGFISGLLTFTPYFHWRWEHALHHGNSGDLDRRGVGDIWTMTVQEYLESSRWKRFAYRLARNPIVLFAVAPAYLFLIRQRFASSDANMRERLSVWWMNLAIAVMALGLSYFFGWKAYVIIQSIVLMVAGASGVWLFYVQHQFEDAYWERSGEWDYTMAALQGSSYYKLPKILQWFSGNIGFHHIHHLSPRIPNYNLERCHESHPLFQRVRPLTFLESFKTMGYRLWDEKLRKLVGFGHIKGMSRAGKTGKRNSSDDDGHSGEGLRTR